jgi:8-amino-7-oxononanoate synthase
MSVIAQALDRLRGKSDGTFAARPFSDLSAYKMLAWGKKTGAMLGIESPFFRSTEGVQGRKTLIDGQPVLNFAWCDYLGLSQHPELIAAGKAAMDQYGTTVSASRMVSGDTPIHRDLEKEIADFLGVDASIVFVSGHAANVSTIGSIMTDSDLIVHDEFVHNSAVMGMRLSGATARPFHHNRLEKLEAILREERAKYRNCLIVIEGLYSTEGDVPDLARLVEIKEKFGAWLMVDDAHGAGVLGSNARGLAEHCGVDPRKVDIWMGTLSKAFASVGGYIAGDFELVEVLKHSAPGFVFSVGLPPSLGAVALTALRVIKREPERVARLHKNGKQFLEEAHTRGLDTGRSLGYGMLPIMVGASPRAAKLVHRMYARGINTSLIIYPGVPMNAGRLRFFLTSEFTPDEISSAVQTAAEEMKLV